MFEHKFSRLVFISAFLCIFSLAGSAQTAHGVSAPAPLVHVPELIANSAKFDGQVVTIAGEVIGDIMRRGGAAWVNVLDDGTALGVWVTAEQAAMIRIAGRYRQTGDIVSVTGIFHRACPDHGGDTDIHAMTLSVVRHGAAISIAADPDRLAAGLVLCVTGGVLAILWRRRERRHSQFPRNDI